MQDVIRLTLSNGERRHLDTGGRREPGMVTGRLTDAPMLPTLEGTVVNVAEIVEAELLFGYDRRIERRPGADWL
jgi:hypothetical protein